MIKVNIAGSEETFKDRHSAELYFARLKNEIAQAKSELNDKEAYLVLLEEAVRASPPTQEELLDRLEEICLDAISYVGAANYTEREAFAQTAIRAAFGCVARGRLPCSFNTLLAKA